MRTLGQERAEFALNAVLENKNIDKLKSFSAGAPTVILQNGFGQAMAFWLSKGGNNEGKEKKYKFISDSIKNWLIKKEFIKSENNDNKKFILKLSEINQNEYLAAQKEALLLLEWIKRYASAFCQDEQDNNDKNGG